MKKITSFSIILILLIASCKRTKPQDDINNEKSSSSEWVIDTLSLQKEVFLNNDSTKGGLKLNLEFCFPVKYTNDSILKDVQSYFVESFTNDENNTYKKMSPTEAFEAFAAKNIAESIELGNDAKEDGIDFSEYYKTVQTSVSNITPIFITGCTQTTQYSGGAHDSQYVNYFNVDISTGKLITLDSLFKKESASQLVPLINQVLAITKNPNGDNITLLDTDSVQPSNNFYFNSDGIVFVYNRYDIAPNSDGLIEVAIGYDKIKDLIFNPYKGIIPSEEKKTE